MLSLFSITNIFRVAFRDGRDPVEFRPSQSLIHILLFQPLDYGVEVFHQRSGVHLICAYGLLEDFWPGLRGTCFKNFSVEGRTCTACLLSQNCALLMLSDKDVILTVESRRPLQSGRCRRCAEARCAWLPHRVFHETGTGG